MKLYCMLIITIAIIENFGKIDGLTVDVVVEDIERFWTNVFQNDILFTRNQSEPSQKITFYETINADLSLKIIAEIRNPLNSLTYTSKYGKPLILCEEEESDDPWRNFVSKLYVNALLPDSGCPTRAGDYKIYRKVQRIILRFPVWPTCGEYIVRSWLLPKGAPEFGEITDFRFKFQIHDECI